MEYMKKILTMAGVLAVASCGGGHPAYADNAASAALVGIAPWLFGILFCLLMVAAAIVGWLPASWYRRRK